jgi:hypothetical protein
MVLGDGDSLTYYSCLVCDHTCPGRLDLSIDSHSWCMARQPWDQSGAGKLPWRRIRTPEGRRTFGCALCEEACGTALSLALEWFYSGNSESCTGLGFPQFSM